MLLLLACVNPDSGALPFLADGVYERSCAPDDGTATEITFGQTGCSANIDGTRVRFLVYHGRETLTMGWTGVVGEEMQASIGEDPAAMENAASGSLRVDAVEDERLGLSWSLTTEEGASYAGEGAVAWCEVDVICG